MPASPPAPRPALLGSLAVCAAIVSGLHARAFAQSPFQPAGRIDKAQFALPWDGPGAAAFNPALLAETRRADLRIAAFGTVSGKAGADFYQGAVRLYRGLSAGLAYFSNGSAVDGSDAFYEESILTPMLAYGLDSVAGSGYSLGLGAALPRHAFNVFGAVKSRANGLDLGAHLLWPSLGFAGRFHTGLGIRNLFAQDIKLPQDFEGGYRGLRPNYDLSVFWGSLAGCIDLYAEYNLHQRPDRSNGSFDESVPPIKSLGIEVRPLPMVGLKLERTWLKTWTAGAVLRVPVRKAELGAEMNLSHDKLFTSQDQGRGYLWSWALNTGF